MESSIGARLGLSREMAKMCSRENEIEVDCLE